MFMTSEHMRWLIDTGEVLTTADGKSVSIYEFSCNHEDEIMSAWVIHFRNHYCLDSEIDIMKNGTGLTRSEYLSQIKFPDHSKAPGPSIRAGDFAEVMIADYLQFCLGYWVPRTRYGNKAIRNESTKGSDIIGIRFFSDEKKPSKDILTIFEAKAQFSSKQKTSRLQDAIDGSAKDQVRKAESLNALKHRFWDLKNIDDFKKIERFQNPEDNPYTELFGAAVVISTHLYEPEILLSANSQAHPSPDRLSLVIIRGENFMDLVHELYRRAADEA
jgi:hypothetical protein